jgi:hypothetical protein
MVTEESPLQLGLVSTYCCVWHMCCMDVAGRWQVASRIGDWWGQTDRIWTSYPTAVNLDRGLG